MPESSPLDEQTWLTHYNLLQEAQRLANIGSWELDLVHNQLTWSDEIFRIFEIDPTKFGASYEAFVETIHPDDRELVNATYQDSVKNHSRYEIVHRLRMQDGRIKYVRERGETFYDEAGNPVRSIGTVQDITEVKRAEDELRQERNFIATLLESANALWLVLDTDGRVIRFNRACERTTGYGAEEVQGKPIWDLALLLPEETHGIKRVFDELRFEAIPNQYENHWVCKDGSKRLIAWSNSTLRNHAGKAEYIISVGIDTTDRHRAEEALQRSEAFSRALSETAPDGIFAIDEEGIIQSCNPAAERIFGYTREEMIGRNISMLMPEPHRSQHDGYLARYCKGGKARIIGIGREVVAQRKDDSLFPLDLSVGEMQVGERRYFTGIVRDITERKRMERIKDEFISTVSHELRTPLTSIRGALGFLAGHSETDLPPQTRTLLEIALRNSERLTHLINDLLDLQKIEAGKMAFDIKAQALMPIVEEALEQALGLQQQYKMQFVVTETLPDARVQVDNARLAQVLANLLSNAAKFSPVGGRVEVSVMRDGKDIRVAVRDHGPGVSPEFREDIFKKFSQADASDTRQKGGTGLGLAICKSIIEQMGGTISYQSTPAKGATFFFTLPEYLAPKA